MNFRRVLVNILKVALALGILWVFLVTACLMIPYTQRDDAANSNLLIQGQVLSRVYEIYTFYPYSDRTPAVGEARRTGRPYLVLDAKLERGHNDTLVLGVRHDSVAFKFAGKEKLEPYHNITLAIPDKRAGISVSAPFAFSSKTSYDYCTMNFGFHVPAPSNNADTALACWWQNHDWFSQSLWLEVAKTAMRTRTIPANNTIELWAESYYWRRPDAPWNPPKMGPFLTIQLIDGGDPIFTFAPSSHSPSKYYSIRIGLFFTIISLTYLLLGPLFLISQAISAIGIPLLILISFMYQLMMAVLGIALLFLILQWFRDGRPSLPVRDVKDAVVEVMRGVRQGRIELPPDQDPDLEAQAHAFVDEMEGASAPESSRKPVAQNVAGSSSHTS